ncbi:amino acid transporter AVT1C-like isoform X1 [Glycine soja]|uniref:amino acid transporter AVT1C-like isoform X1 n=1 Tax=Glycine soja TaxID=3848 RepID=UPI00103EDFCF|nr:amino acid transporter AVT1C-like isoform X1 [Glycine soja]XP_028208099.1 amino acid transporter AVT1C-like isoform X1 [Glycine soja]XP_028208108.1 amino acid transporter AVT1C-like isoform X1 [Glycine soja]XP_028208116.1 amino acid transporter AVT1C-like isoform X1 [Glycine soja]XP_028208125.1 amino acid transporter AVT1C-like isoform X1 [Glycine soja]
MKNSASESGLYIIESDEDVEKDLQKDENDGNESDYSNDSNENQSMRKPSNYSIAWPQSYRQSIDLYGSVPSPNIGFLGTTSLSRLGSSFISSSLTRRHTLEVLQPEKKPLLKPTEEEQPRHTLLPPQISRKSSIRISKVSHEPHIPGQCTFGQAVLNGINALCGIGILSTPYAAKEGGWVGLSILLLYAVFSFYTGLLLRYCLDSAPGLETYPDIGQAAFGTTGRVIISIILYMELYACCIEYIIVESDNLSTLFPNAHISLGGTQLNAHILFAILTALALLPTVWLRDLRILSYISACGVVATILVVLCLFWVCFVDNADIHTQGTTTTFNFATFPVAIGLYGYCYAGHAVFPNLYTAMANRNQFPGVLLVCFAICTTMYCAVAIMGYAAFGEATLSQYTLNMPQHLVAAKIAVWTTVVNPFTKYALSLSPVAMCLEELIPTNSPNFFIYSKLIRTALVVSTLLVGLSVPFFGLVMSLTGSLLTMFVSLILPAACFLSIRGGRITRFQVSLCVTIIAVGVVSSCFGSYSALYEIIEELFKA